MIPLIGEQKHSEKPALSLSVDYGCSNSMELVHGLWNLHVPWRMSTVSYLTYPLTTMWCRFKVLPRASTVQRVTSTAVLLCTCKFPHSMWHFLPPPDWVFQVTWLVAQQLWLAEIIGTVRFETQEKPQAAKSMEYLNFEQRYDIIG